MAGGELSAVFKGLAGDADQAAGNIAESVAKMGERTAENEEANLARTLDSEAQNAKAFTDIAKGDAKVPEPTVSPQSAAPAGAAEPGGTPFHEPKVPDGIGDNNPVPAENAQPTESVPQSKDPIDFTTGRVLLDQLDLELPGTLPLRLTRCHRSTLRIGRWFGRTWSSTMDQRIEVTEDAVHFAAADGMLLKYPVPAIGAPVLPVVGVPWPLHRTEDGGHTILDPGSGRTLHFAAVAGDRAPITAISDRNGNRIDFDHDGHGVLTEIRHSGGHRVAVDTDDGLITALRLRNPAGADVVVRRYRYNSLRQLTEVVGPSGRPTLFEYDADGRLTRWEDTNGMWYRYDYDADGRCVRADGRDGYLAATVEYDRDNLVTTATDSLGNATTYHLNDRLQVIREVDPLGNARTFEWDRHHRLLAQTDALGRTSRYDYERGKLVRSTRPDGVESTAEYDALGRPTTVVEPDGVTWRQAYDEQGNLVAVTDPTGATTAYDYDEHGGLVAVRDALGNVVRIATDPAGLPLAFTDATGRTVRYRRDFCGRVVEIVDPVGGSTRFTWTVGGQLRSRTEPDGTVEQWHHDGETNVVDHIDALGQRTHTEIAHFDLPVSRTGPDGARLAFRYDTELRLAAVTNPQGLVWRYEYDAAGNLVRETDFNGRVLAYQHDAAGQLVQRVDGAGASTSLRRDELGNLVERRSGTAVTTFEYDAAGRLRRAVNADAELVFERDPLGRVLAETCNGRTVRSVFDAIGRRVRRVTPSGMDSDWSYDARDLPMSLGASGRVMLRFGYDDAGRETERDLGGGAVLTQTWDANHRLHTQAIAQVPGPAGNSPLLQRRSYSYRPDGFLTAIVDQVAGPRQFDLDRIGQVVGVTGTGWTERYAYDAAGNVTNAEWPGADAAGPREYHGTLVRRAGNVRYEHDAQGRITLRQKKRLSGRPLTWRYAWDTDDRLVGVTTPDGQRWRYRYDPLGRRIAKQLVGPDASTVDAVVFAWDGARLAEQATPDQRVTMWDWAPGHFRPVSQRERVPLRHAPQGVIDERFYAIVTDLVGTPTELVSQDGHLVWRNHTSLWGAPRNGADGGGVTTPLRFPGQYRDQESELNYNYQRYYDAETGRYTSADPLGLNPAPNPHAYVPNPAGLIDPLGLAPYKIYRGMKDDNGAPKVEPTARGLGARPGGDIKPDENGMVHPPENPADAQGMSTAPEKPGNLPAHRRPPELGTGKGGVGTGKDPVWSLDPDKLPDGLVGVRDSPTHVTIAPSRTMPFDEYQALIATTKGLWEKVEP
ncbi:MAG TPA: RHS repeat-associated core domain-containing protein [Pseudonocardiaceae bacterium]|jgi:RHS repeat-associated protein